jgi:hypothetical protein
MNYCIECGFKRIVNSKYCSNCGNEFDFIKSNPSQENLYKESIEKNDSTENKVQVFQELKSIIPFRISVTDKLKTGIINLNGDWIVQPQFDVISGTRYPEILLASNDDKYGIINLNGDWIVQPQFDRISETENPEIFIAYYNDGCGLINSKGDWVVQPLFDFIWPTANPEIFIAEKNDKVGLINLNGDWIVQPQFERISETQNPEIFIAEKNDKYGLINSQGNLIVQPQFERISKTENPEIFIAKNNDKCGFINSQGDLIVHPQFDYISETQNPEIFIAKNHKYGLINSQGDWVIHPQFDDIKYIGNDLIRVEVVGRNCGLYSEVSNGVMDIKGNWIIDLRVNVNIENLFGASDNNLLIRNKDNKKSLYNITSKVMFEANYDIISPIYDLNQNTVNDFYFVCQNQYQGIINSKEEWVVAKKQYLIPDHRKELFPYDGDDPFDCWETIKYDYDLFLSDIVDNEYTFLGHNKIIEHLLHSYGSFRGLAESFHTDDMNISVDEFKDILSNEVKYKFLYNYKYKNTNDSFIILSINDKEDSVLVHFNKRWTLKGMDLSHFTYNFEFISENSSAIEFRLNEEIIKIKKHNSLFGGSWKYNLKDVFDRAIDMVESEHEGI